MKKNCKQITGIIFVLSAIYLSGCATTTPLQNAIIQKKYEKAKLLAKKDKSSIDNKNAKGQTALILASIQMQEDLMRSILEAGADPNIQNHKGVTALVEATYKGIPSNVSLLLNHGAEVDLADKDGWTPLFWSIYKNYYPITKTVIESNTNINHVSIDGMSPLIFATKEGNTAIATLLLSKGATNPDLQDNDGMTALMHASVGGHKTIVKKMLDRGARTDLLSRENKTARGLAEETGFPEIVMILDNTNSEKRNINSTKEKQDKVILKKVLGKLNNEEIMPTWVRAMELRSAKGHFLDLLCESDLFDQIDTLDGLNQEENATFLRLTVEETENTNKAANVTKAFLSGFLTLGLVPPSANYGYKTTITLVVEQPDGQIKEHTASADTTTKWRGDPRTAAYIKKAGSAKKVARRLITHQALESLITQLSKNNDN